MLKGEALLETANRKLKIETGLDAKFKLIGIERRRKYENGELFSDTIFPITYADKYTEDLIDTEFGHNVWVSIDQAIKNESNPHDSLQTIPKILKALKKGALTKLLLFYEDTIQGL